MVKKSIVALLHVGFWVCYLVLVMVVLSLLYGGIVDVPERPIEDALQIILFFVLVPSAISFYSFYFLLFPNNSP